MGLIALRTAEMGHIWHQRQTDAGIDREIALRDADGTVRNLVVMVQSKASDRPFSGETDHAFHFVVDQRACDPSLLRTANDVRSGSRMKRIFGFCPSTLRFFRKLCFDRSWGKWGELTVEVL